MRIEELLDLHGRLCGDWSVPLRHLANRRLEDSERPGRVERRKTFQDARLPAITVAGHEWLHDYEQYAQARGDLVGRGVDVNSALRIRYPLGDLMAEEAPDELDA